MSVESKKETREKLERLKRVKERIYKFGFEKEKWAQYKLWDLDIKIDVLENQLKENEQESEN